ncbi:MAG: GntG family PLP-dependent aldolase [Planctomycetota bacterium]|nr:GntG family PLP-dependent aldolase [Planctomycetota bacterium]
MIDLRSDTVTQPSDAMKTAMSQAPLGDDVLGDEPTVMALECKIAELLGKEAAAFTPSGTMANQLAIRSVCESGDEIIAHRDSHVIHYETGAPAALSGCMIAPLEGTGGIFGAEEMTGAIRGLDDHNPVDRMVIVENTHNRGGGTAWTLEGFTAVATSAHRHGLHVHVDGARLFNAVTASSYQADEFAAPADSLSVCFSKGLGAPVGSALVGSRELIDRAKRFRKMFGGSMRQSGILAAAAIHALDHNLERLQEDHANARALNQALAGIEGIHLERATEEIPSNMVFFTLDPEGPSAAEFCSRLERHGVRMIPMGARRVRAVTHLDVRADAMPRAAEACASVLTELVRTTGGGR